jgi:acyl-coenzyme A thioesterase PaaI-like protein
MSLFPANLDILKRKVKQNVMPLLTPHLFKLRINTYAPYVGAGIKIEHLNMDQGLCIVGMELTALNKNIVGTQFGGSLYSMIDPFYMMLLMQQLGSNYVVWAKSSHIKFVAPGTSKVTARIKVSTSEVTEIRELAESGEPVFRDYRTEVVDHNQKVIAIVTKTVYIRLRKHSKSKNQSSRLDLPDK